VPPTALSQPQAVLQRELQHIQPAVLESITKKVSKINNIDKVSRKHCKNANK
jgi:hypothetical protein